MAMGRVDPAAKWVLMATYFGRSMAHGAIADPKIKSSAAQELEPQFPDLGQRALFF
jgi:hypothetical protein